MLGLCLDSCDREGTGLDCLKGTVDLTGAAGVTPSFTSSRSLSVSRLMISSFLGLSCLCRGSSVNNITGRGVLVVGVKVGKKGVGVVVSNISSGTMLSAIVGRKNDDSSISSSSSPSSEL